MSKDVFIARKYLGYITEVNFLAEMCFLEKVGQNRSKRRVGAKKSPNFGDNFNKQGQKIGFGEFFTPLVFYTC